MSEEKETFKPQQIASMKKFVRTYQMSRLGYRDLYEVYIKNALTPDFQNTKYSAFFLIIAPALTNIYYTFRPSSALTKIMPLAMPFMALGQYIFTIRRDMQRFCLNDNEDAERVRQKYILLQSLESYNPGIQKVVNNIQELQKQKQQEAK